MPISEEEKHLLQKLEDAQLQLNSEVDRWLSSSNIDQSSFDSANAAVLEIERELAQVRGEEFAISANLTTTWQDESEVLILSTGYTTILAFEALQQENDPSKSEQKQSWAIVLFLSLEGLKSESDCDSCSNRLEGRGLDRRIAQEIKNSSWLNKLIEKNNTSELYSKEYWEKQKHFAFWFSHMTVECIAAGFHAEVVECTKEALWNNLSKRFLT